LTAALLLMALILPPLTGATKGRRAEREERAEAPARATSRLEAGAAQVGPGRPVSMQAANFAESETVAAIAKAQAKAPASKRRAPAADREELLEKAREKNLRALGVDPEATGDEEEINKTNREITRAFDYKAATAPDAALAAVPGSKGGNAPSPLVMPTPNVSFNGIGNPDGCGGCLPPDTNGDIGPTQYVQTVNTAFRVWNRSGTALTPVLTLGSLFAALPGVCANTNDGDPIVMYDQLADRWMISQFCWSVAVPNHQIIAVSKTGDATGAYYLYDFVMPNIKFNDYPHFGIWPDGYYMTDNQFNQAGTAFQGAGVFAFDRVKMLSGDPTASFIYFDKAEGCTGNGATCQFGGMLPADLDGFRPPPAGAPNTIMQFDADEFNAATPDSMRIFDFHVDYATPANSTLVERTGSPLSVAAFDPREVPSGSRNVVPQPAGTAVDVISDRLMFRLAYRNFGTHESLTMSHTVNAATNPAFRAGVRYYEIRKTTPTGAYVVQEQATMAGAAGDLEHRFMGSTALNNAGSQAVAYSVSSSTVFPSVRYAGRLAGDTAGSLAQGEATMVAGSGAQTSTSGRWGDYSDITVDPLDDCTFWYTQEYYSATSGANWNTRIGSFTFGPCPAIQKGVLNGTVTSSATGNPIANATVTASNGFSRASGANGVYNIDPMGSGTVTLTVSAAGYQTATVPGVTVTNGNTTTQNVQLVPLSNIVTGPATIVADSCNTNMTLDPNEVVTVNFALSNIGGDGASTTALTATLQPTGGVINPSGPQNYGAVVAGQPAVTKPFTFTVSASCGGTVTATLALQDGNTNYGTRTYTFQVGTLAGSFPTTGGISTIVPDNTPAGVDIPIVVPDNVNITDVNVRFRANMTFDGDLNLSLVHPDGTTVALSTGRGGSGDNFGTGTNDCSGVPTVFDDAAATTIANGAAPFAGSFHPEGSLATLNGKPANGTWKLHAVDTANLDVATVGCVTLEINKRFVCCGVELAQGAPAYSIVSESVSPANNAPDPDETVTVNFALTNVGGSNASNLVATLQPGGGVSGPSAPQSYGALASGATASRPFTFAVNAACGSNITATLAMQDGATALAPIQFTIPVGTLSPVTQTFSNAAPIVINDATTATPYPSNITVSGLSGTVSKVTMTLTGLNHTFPSDVDMLLVNPTGRKFIVLSDVIGGTDWVNINYTLDDAAAGFVAGSGTPVSGTFKPTNFTTCQDAFAAPAPAGTYLSPGAATGTQCGTETMATAFNGTNPNGAWALYVVDDAGTDVGTVSGGWSLAITAAATVCNTQACTINVPANITTPATGPSGAVVNYTIPQCTGSCGTVTGSPASGSTFPVGTTQVTVTGTRADNSTTTNTFTVTVTQPNPPTASTSLAIGEFRLHGAAGGADEYVEIANLSNSPYTVNASDASAGWAVAALNAAGTVASTVGTIPNGTTIPAYGHYLIANSSVGGYSLGAYATPDATFTADIPDNVGIALFNTANAANFVAANRIDAVGFTGQGGALAPLYSEGTRLAPVTGDGEYAYVRRMETGVAQDTGSNVDDFVLVSTTGGTFGTAQSVRGAPGPENLTSATQRNATIKAAVIDPTQASTAPPNRVRDTTPNVCGAGGACAEGTLDIRRKFTNQTGAPVTFLRFRVVDITTQNTPNPGGQQADLRLLTSTGTTANGGTITITGTTVQAPANGTSAGGAGLNASAVVAIPGGTLGVGNSVNVRFLLGVASGGRFRFFINVEGLNGSPLNGPTKTNPTAGKQPLQ
jgi:subtilisin-like proprotein convertase family protein